MEQVSASYGKVPADEYLQLTKSISKGKPQIDSTFREDYEIGVYEGKFFVSYHGECQECKLKHVFKHEQAIDWFPKKTSK